MTKQETRYFLGGIGAEWGIGFVFANVPAPADRSIMTWSLWSVLYSDADEDVGSWFIRVQCQFPQLIRIGLCKLES